MKTMFPKLVLSRHVVSRIPTQQNEHVVLKHLEDGKVWKVTLDAG